MSPRRLACGLGLAALTALPAPAPAFEVCMEGGAWLAYYASEVQKENWPRVLELTVPQPGQSRAELQEALERARAEGELEAGALAELSIEGTCTSEGPEIARLVATYGLNPDSILGYRLGRAFVVLSIVGPPDWFNFVAADLEGL